VTFCRSTIVNRPPAASHGMVAYVPEVMVVARTEKVEKIKRVQYSKKTRCDKISLCRRL